MFKRLKSLAVLVILFPVVVNAIGLGGITDRSQVGENLDIELILEGVGADNLGDLKVGLASREEFLDARIAYPRDDSIFGFDVREANGGSRLVITSTTPFPDSHLRLLIEVVLREDGLDVERVVKEYIILLEPSSSQNAIQPNANLELETDNEEASIFSTKERSFITGDGDSLSGIVKGLDVPDSISIYQITSAIVRASPNAFLDGNMNQLIIGEKLTIPSWQAISEIDENEALDDFNDQAERYAKWLEIGSSSDSDNSYSDNDDAALQGEESETPVPAQNLNDSGDSENENVSNNGSTGASQSAAEINAGLEGENVTDSEASEAREVAALTPESSEDVSAEATLKLSDRADSSADVQHTQPLEIEVVIISGQKTEPSISSDESVGQNSFTIPNIIQNETTPLSQTESGNGNSLALTSEDELEKGVRTDSTKVDSENGAATVMDEGGTTEIVDENNIDENNDRITEYGLIESPEAPMLLDSTSELTYGINVLKDVDEGAESSDSGPDSDIVTVEENPDTEPNLEKSIPSELAPEPDGETEMVIETPIDSTVSTTGDTPADMPADTLADTSTGISADAPLNSVTSIDGGDNDGDNNLSIRVTPLEKDEVSPSAIDEEVVDQESFTTAFTILGDEDEVSAPQLPPAEIDSADSNSSIPAQSSNPVLEGGIDLKIKQILERSYGLIYEYVSKLFWVLLGIILLLLGYRFVMMKKKKLLNNDSRMTEVTSQGDESVIEDIADTEPFVSDVQMQSSSAFQEPLSELDSTHTSDDSRGTSGVMGTVLFNGREGLDENVADEPAWDDDQNQQLNEQTSKPDEAHESAAEVESVSEKLEPVTFETDPFAVQDLGSEPTPGDEGGESSDLAEVEATYNEITRRDQEQDNLPSGQVDILELNETEVGLSIDEDSRTNEEDVYTGDEDEDAPTIIAFDDSADEGVDLQDPETALDLARAYLKLGQESVAKGFIDEVIVNGNEAQKALAHALSKELSDSEE